jgi:hypothetical protein
MIVSVIKLIAGLQPINGLCLDHIGDHSNSQYSFHGSVHYVGYRKNVYACTIDSTGDDYYRNGLSTISPRPDGEKRNELWERAANL